MKIGVPIVLVLIVIGAVVGGGKSGTTDSSPGEGHPNSQAVAEQRSKDAAKTEAEAERKAEVTARAEAEAKKGGSRTEVLAAAGDRRSPGRQRQFELRGR